MQNVVKSLWIGDSLSRMEHSCVLSWLNAGYEYELYVYNDVQNVPSGVKICDGNCVISSSKIFRYNQDPSRGGGSVSGFSNFFRYKLLIDGGMWADTDMFCLNRIPDDDYLLIKENESIASCLLRIPADMAKYCWDVCCSKDPMQLKWGETGPKLVKEASAVFGLDHMVRESEMYLPIMYSDVDSFFEDVQVPKCYTLHFWHEIWRRKCLNKASVYNQNTLYERLINHVRFI